MSEKSLDTSTLQESTERDELPFLRTNGFSSAIDRTVLNIGNAFSWVWAILLVVIITNVILRYVFSQGMIELEELQWYLYAAAWLVGLSYTFVIDGHVRVDVVLEKLPPRTRLRLELFGLLVFFMPFILFVIYFSLPFVSLSWETGETSTSANGLPARWLIKGCLTFAFVLLALVGISRLVKVIDTLKNGPVGIGNEVPKNGSET